ncbi:MAG: hypothetical protein ACKVOW_13340 [Chitinophagaceae bacterium]
MNEQQLNFFLSLSVAFPAIAGIIKFGKISKTYNPFLLYVFVSLANELLVGLVLVHHSKNIQTLDWEIFNLFEGLVLLVQFHYWKLFEKNQKLFYALIILFAGSWLVENFIISDIYSFKPYYVLGYSLIIALLSIQTINHIIIHQNQVPLFRNAMFIICVALVIYFIYNIYVFTMITVGLSNFAKTFKENVFGIKVYSNVFINLLMGIAVCLIPSQKTGANFFNRAANN